MTQFMLIRAQKCIKSSNVLLRAGNRDIWIAVIITVCIIIIYSIIMEKVNKTIECFRPFGNFHNFITRI